MNFITKWLVRFQVWRAERRAAYLKALAAASPGFEWLIVRAGTAEKSRSPMLSVSEVREWFREEFPAGRIVQLDTDNKIVFYE